MAGLGVRDAADRSDARGPVGARGLGAGRVRRGGSIDSRVRLLGAADGAGDIELGGRRPLDRADATARVSAVRGAGRRLGRGESGSRGRRRPNSSGCTSTTSRARSGRGSKPDIIGRRGRAFSPTRHGGSRRRGRTGTSRRRQDARHGSAIPAGRGGILEGGAWADCDEDVEVRFSLDELKRDAVLGHEHRTASSIRLYRESS
jgi:hypothetical protein